LRDAGVLTGESSGKQSWSLPFVSVELFNVIDDWNVRPMLGQNPVAEWIAFAEANSFQADVATG
jgi:hypothetical protein